MTERLSRLNSDGEFLPFDPNLSEFDFDYDFFAERMELSHLQSELFRQLLQRLEIKVWFNEEYLKDRAPGDLGRDKVVPGSSSLILNVFWGAAQEDGCTSVDLIKMIENCVTKSPDDEIYCEIEVLERLRDVCDRAIELRKKEDAR